MNSKGAVAPLDEEAQRKMWRKVGFRLLPLVAVAYIISYIDRANLGYVAEPMGSELSMTSAQIGLAAGLFFIGYILLEIPSNMMLNRFGARLWISRIIVSWGLVTMLTGAVHSVTQLYIARTLLGVAEAGLSAGILLYLTHWFPKRQRTWAMAIFFMTIPASAIVGAPLAAALLQWGQFVFGISGWRSLFVVEGALTVVIGVIILFALPNRPSNAKWLDASEKQHIESTLAAETAQQVSRGAITGIRQALTDRKVWALGFAFFSIVFGLYPLAFFLPTMISSFTETVGAANNVSSVLLAAVPSAVAIIVMLIWSRVAARRSIVFSTVVPMAFGAIGLVAATLAQDGLLFIVAVCVSVSGIYTAMPQFWRLPGLALSGAAAAVGIALINSVSNISGFVGPYVTGAIETATGSFTYALLTIAAVMCAGIGVLLTSGRKAEALGQNYDDVADSETATLNSNNE